MSKHYYWPLIDSTTREVSLQPVLAEYRGGMYHIPKNALVIKPLPQKAGFAVVALEDMSGTKYIEDHRGITIYDESDCTKSETVSGLGPITDGFTSDKPLTKFDERIDGAWVTNESDKFIAEYSRVDDARRYAYTNIVTPLTDEAYMKRYIIKTPESIAEADELEKQAMAARLKIQAENPWPTFPTN